jgi:hypothetical protein
MTDNEAIDPSQSDSGPRAVPLRDELGIEDLSDPIFGGRGRLFSAAGRDSPIAELTQGFVVLHPPQSPFNEEGSDELLPERFSDRGVLLNSIGEEINIPGAKFRGHQLFCMGMRDATTGKHAVAWFKENGLPSYLMLEGRVLTYNTVIHMRNGTHDGELSIVPLLNSVDDLQ